jgi:hypothetical protein
MIRNRWTWSAALCLSLLGGCDDSKQASTTPDPTTQPTDPATPPQPTVAQATGTTAAKPAATQAVITTFRVFERSTPDDIGVLHDFPGARLHINTSDNTAVLYSDDPKAAIKPTYSGNSFYLVIPLDKDEPLKLDGYQWQFKTATTGDHQDSTDGIFIDGQRYHLQPADVTVAFQGKGPEIKVAVVGHFTKFDTMANGGDKGCPVYLKGIVVAKMDSGK